MIIILLLYLVIIVTLCLAIYHASMRFSREGRLIDKIPGPVALPIFGNALEFNIPPERIWNKVLDLYDEYYPIFKLWSFKSYAAFLRHPDDIKKLLSCKTNIDKSETAYGSLRSCGTDGIILNGGDKWRQRRKMVNPGFNPNLLKVYTEIMYEHIENMIRDLKSGDKEMNLKLEPFFLKFALAFACEATMGVNLNKFPPEREEQYRHSFDTISEIAFYRAARPYIADWMMKFLPVGWKQARAVKIAAEFADEIISERRKYHERVGYRSFEKFVDDIGDTRNLSEMKGLGKRKRLAVLDLLLAAEMDGLIDADGIREEVDSFVAAAYETVNSAICFALMLFAENKWAQERTRKEICEIFNQNKGSIAMAEIQKLDYLDRCCKETLRLFPSAPIIGRSLTQDLQIKDYVLPKHTEVFVQFFALHRDPKFWPEPNKFDPDRFLPENIQNRHPFAFVPFSGGLRNCIGQKLGVIELKSVLAYVLYNFYVEPVDSTTKVKFTLHVTLKPSEPIHVKLVRIDKDKQNIK